MKRLVFAPLVSLVLVVPAGPVLGQFGGGFGNMFDRFDQNDDGVLTSDELPDSRTAAFFERMGLDLSRGVRQEDVEQAFRNRSGFGRRGGDDDSRRGRGGNSRSEDASNRARERAQRLAQRTVQRYDQNNDGVLASDEIPDRLRGDLDGLDANSDGILSSDELAGRYAPRSDDARGGGSNQQAFPFVTGPGYPAGLPSWFQQSDGNRDGQVALYEWDRRQLAQFKTYDQNDDGFITSDEAILSNQRSGTAFGDRGGFTRGGGRENFGGGRGGFSRGGGRGNFGGGRSGFSRGGGRGNFGGGRSGFSRGGGRGNFGGGQGGFSRGGGRGNFGAGGDNSSGRGDSSRFRRGRGQ